MADKAPAPSSPLPHWRDSRTISDGRARIVPIVSLGSPHVKDFQDWGSTLSGGRRVPTNSRACLIRMLNDNRMILVDGVERRMRIHVLAGKPTGCFGGYGDEGDAVDVDLLCDDRGHWRQQDPEWLAVHHKLVAAEDERIAQDRAARVSKGANALAEKLGNMVQESASSMTKRTA